MRSTGRLRPERTVDKYTPIPCEVYGNYELAILRRSGMRVCWRGSRKQLRIDSGVLVNIRTRCQGEFLVLRKRSGIHAVMRLDRIVRIRALTKPSRTPNRGALTT